MLPKDRDHDAAAEIAMLKMQLTGAEQRHAVEIEQMRLAFQKKVSHVNTSLKRCISAVMIMMTIMIKMVNMMKVMIMMNVMMKHNDYA